MWEFIWNGTRYGPSDYNPRVRIKSIMRPHSSVHQPIYGGDQWGYYLCGDTISVVHQGINGRNTVFSLPSHPQTPVRRDDRNGGAHHRRSVHRRLASQTSRCHPRSMTGRTPWRVSHQLRHNPDPCPRIAAARRRCQGHGEQFPASGCDKTYRGWRQTRLRWGRFSRRGSYRWLEPRGDLTTARRTTAAAVTPCRAVLVTVAPIPPCWRHELLPRDTEKRPDWSPRTRRRRWPGSHGGWFLPVCLSPARSRTKRRWCGSGVTGSVL
jgi:hypothetical protein